MSAPQNETTRSISSLALCASLALLTSVFAHAAGTQQSAQVRRGEYLVRISDCNACHTPFKLGPQGPEPDMSRMLSGHPQDLALPPAPTLPQGPWAWLGAGTNTAFAGPWGVSYAVNLTPDDTGLGKWDEKTFVAALRSGKHLGVGRPILPPMPWPAYGQMTEQDLKAVFAYLRTVPKIRNEPPASIPAAPVAVR